MEVNSDFLLAVYGSALDDSSALYCSAPITSGRRFIRWVRQRGNDIRDVDHAAADYASEHRRHVIVPNLSHASGIIRALRQRSPIPVIDPTIVPHVATWTQSNWLSFWERVIGRFAVGIVFVDDWQFSYGCSHEFVYAHTVGIPAFSEEGHPIGSATGQAMIEAAISEIAAIGGSTTRLESTLELLAKSVSETVSAGMSLDELLRNYDPHAFQRRDSQ